MRNIKLIIEYEGTDYNGWQIQPGLKTVQGVLQSKLSIITKAETIVIGSGRTDSGVHASWQVVNFKTESRMKPDEFKAALNSLLPKDIVVKHAEEVEDSFHARYSAIGRTYRYTILNSKTPWSFLQRYVYMVHYPIQIDKMAEASQCLIGTHDFTSFASDGDHIKNYVRTVFDAKVFDSGYPSLSFPLFYLNDVFNNQEKLICFQITGNGFLRSMVRAITGTLLEIGKGKMPSEKMKEILDGKDRTLAGPSLPARGLCLIKVNYLERY